MFDIGGARRCFSGRVGCVLEFVAGTEIVEVDADADAEAEGE